MGGIAFYLFLSVNTDSHEYETEETGDKKESLYMWLYTPHQKAPFQSDILFLLLNKSILLTLTNKNLVQYVHEL
jgi:hypothetical protein